MGCVNVSTEDEILEANEIYQFRIVPVANIVRVTGEPVNVTIIDNDSKSNVVAVKILCFNHNNVIFY